MSGPVVVSGVLLRRVGVGVPEVRMLVMALRERQRCHWPLAVVHIPCGARPALGLAGRVPSRGQPEAPGAVVREQGRRAALLGDGRVGGSVAGVVVLLVSGVGAVVVQVGVLWWVGGRVLIGRGRGRGHGLAEARLRPSAWGGRGV